MASVIAGSRLFAGNQSVGYALAEAMKVDGLLEAYPGFLDCGFSRPNLRQVPTETSRWPGLPAFWTRLPTRQKICNSEHVSPNEICALHASPAGTAHGTKTLEARSKPSGI